MSLCTLEQQGAPGVSRLFAWLVFALIIGLLLSDYMSRQVINGVFPLLKAEWALTDRQLGLLGGIVPMMVGILTVPLSYVADRLGRVRSIVIMAGLWSLAIWASALAQNYGEMLLARLMVGFGEAAYGSVGLAVIFSVFPAHLRSTLSGLYGGAALLGAVLGLALGGKLAALFGWRGAFIAMAAFGIVLVAMFMIFVRERKLGQARAARPMELGRMKGKDILGAMFKTRSVLLTCLGSGAQIFTTGAMIVWTPTYFGRYYELPTEKAAVMAAGFILISGLGMCICGNIADRLSRDNPGRRLLAATAYCLVSLIFLSVAFRLPPGNTQLILFAIGIFTASGIWGPANAVVANLTPATMHSTSIAILTLINNLIGLAPGPFATGVLADKYGLNVAFQWVPLASIVAVLAFYMAWRHYDGELQQKLALYNA